MQQGGRTGEFIVRTHLEMTAPPAGTPATLPSNATVEPVASCTVDEYLAMYRAVGRPWRWTDRYYWGEAKLAEYLTGPVKLWRLVVDGAFGGYFELAPHADGSVELMYFGLVPERIGQRLGRGFLARAVAEAWALEPRPTRLIVNTCTLDHPRALSGYTGSGFRITHTDAVPAPQPEPPDA